MNIENLDKRYSQGSQDFYLHSYYRLQETKNNHALFVDIRRDTYNHQSYARISFLTKTGWELLYFIPYSQMMAIVGNVSHLSQQKLKPVLDHDEKILLDMAQKLLKNQF